MNILQKLAKLLYKLRFIKHESLWTRLILIRKEEKSVNDEDSVLHVYQDIYHALSNLLKIPEIYWCWNIITHYHTKTEIWSDGKLICILDFECIISAIYNSQGFVLYTQLNYNVKYTSDGFVFLLLDWLIPLRTHN